METGVNVMRIVVEEISLEVEISKHPLHVRAKNVKEIPKNINLATIRPVQVHL